MTEEKKLKWDEKPAPPMGPCDPQEVLEFTRMVRNIPEIWDMYQGLKPDEHTPSEIGAKIIGVAMQYEKDTGIYISPEATMATISGLRFLSKGDFKDFDDKKLLDHINSTVKTFCNS